MKEMIKHHPLHCLSLAGASSHDASPILSAAANKKGGPLRGRPYHHKYIDLGIAVPRQVVPEGVVETGSRPSLFLLLLKGD